MTQEAWLTEQDLFLFNEGTHRFLHRKLGAHLVDGPEGPGTYFAVWAPNAERVAVVGSFNDWQTDANPLAAQGGSGIWVGFVPGVGQGTLYKFYIRSRTDGYEVRKADPFGFHHEQPPNTASVVHGLDYRWGDSTWMMERGPKSSLDAPMSIYELHLGSWRRVPEDGNRSLSYREAADQLVEYCTRLGFTHVEFMPIMEHPFDGSWGYQVTGYFAPTSRFGSPQDFMFLVDRLHQAGIGVILDWVPAHFPTDEHGLGYFDGTHLFEHADPRKGYHPDWNTYIFNYDRHEVRSFLLSSALFWLDQYHVDGLRVDGVASMLYLDYSRQVGEWIPNEHGGRENLGAIQFLKEANEAVFADFPGTQTMAEESTSWPMVSRPTYLGGLGFGLKWDMGWMHDTLGYFQRDPVHRRWHHNELTFRSIYWTHENFVLPLSHDEVVHGKGSLLGKMPGDEWQRAANLRLLFSYMWAIPGKKLLFMGGEFGQIAEWNHDGSLEWHLEGADAHAGIQRAVASLNELYRRDSAMHQRDCHHEGFEWVAADDSDASVLAFLRWDEGRKECVLCVFNFTPEPRYAYRIGVNEPGFWREVFNSDAAEFGGSGMGNLGGLEAEKVEQHGRPCSLPLTLPPLAALYLRRG